MGIGGMTISTVSGWSKQHGLHLQRHGQPVTYDLLSSVEIVVPDSQTNKVVPAVIESGRTGENGDGTVFVSTIEQAYNIATLDEDEKIIV